MEFLRLQVLEQQNIIDDLSKVQSSLFLLLTPTDTQTPLMDYYRCNYLPGNVAGSQFSIEHKHYDGSKHHADDVYYKNEEELLLVFMMLYVLLHLS